MDSKLVVEQMCGNWKIKHPDMRPLAMEANRLAPAARRHDVHLGAARAEQARRPAGQRGARRQALRGHLHREHATRHRRGRDSAVEEAQSPRGGSRSRPRSPATAAGHRPEGRSTTLILVRHGVTAHTAEKRFSGGLGQQQPRAHRRGPRPGPRGRRLARADRRGGRRRGHLAGAPHPRVGRDPGRAPRAALVEEPGFAEMEFGAWDGMTFAEVARTAPGRDRCLARLARRRAGGGESFREVEKRVLDGLSRVLDDVRRQDRRRGQPRDADQDPGRARRRRAAGGGVPDGAVDGVGQRRVVLRRAEQRRHRAARCGCTTRSRPVPARCSTRSAGEPVRAR